MERKHYLSLLVSICLLMTSCATGGGEGEYYDFLNDVTPSYSSYGIGGEGGPGGGTSSGTGGNTQAGIVTAGEWRDLEHWIFWAGLMQGDEFGDKSDYWNFFTNNRVAVKVTKPNGQPAAGVAVELLHNGKVQWQAITDNHGEAECWIGLYQPVTTTSEELTLTLDGQLMEGHPALCKWESTTTQIAVNHYTITSPAVETQQADIAFIVDATGSMGDEINFLKSDLLDIIDKVSAVHPETTIRTAALFYRDEDDDYLTCHSNFSNDASQTAQFVSQQQAEGGGDYPEAVHSALEHMLQDLSWDSNARSRIAFLILDAPAHHETEIISSLQRSVLQCAKLGIRLIPVAASGVDKNTEFMSRFFAISTGGTYVFLTNDSGVGNDHITATVGDYEVEQLNNLLIRLISYYTE